MTGGYMLITAHDDGTYTARCYLLPPEIAKGQYADLSDLIYLGEGLYGADGKLIASLEADSE